MKFKIGKALILDESLKGRADWYKPVYSILKRDIQPELSKQLKMI